MSPAIENLMGQRTHRCAISLKETMTQTSLTSRATTIVFKCCYANCASGPHNAMNCIWQGICRYKENFRLQISSHQNQSFFKSTVIYESIYWPWFSKILLKLANEHGHWVSPPGLAIQGGNVTLGGCGPHYTSSLQSESSQLQQKIATRDVIQERACSKAVTNNSGSVPTFSLLTT